MAQEDYLYGDLTARECVEYSALLRLPKTRTYKEKQNEVGRTIKELHLDHVAENITSSLSGGERKRVAIAMELVSNPNVLALDEPTSGLDSTASLNIMSVLSEVASKDRIVILSIHQPSTRAFFKLDRILVLANGSPMFSGKPSKVRTFLNNCGFPHQDIPSPDHILDVISEATNHGVIVRERKRLGQKHVQLPAIEGSGQPDQANNARGSILNEVAVLFKRTAKVISRNRQLFLTQVTVSAVIACFTGAIFRGLSKDLAGFQNRLGVSNSL